MNPAIAFSNVVLSQPLGLNQGDELAFPDGQEIVTVAWTGPPSITRKKSPAPDKLMQFLDCAGLVHRSQMACVGLGRFLWVFPDVFQGRGEAMASFSTFSGLARR